MIKVNNLTPDSACRTFFNNDIYFSAFCNVVLFNGKHLISASDLIHYENDSAVIINDTKKVEDKKEEEISLLEVIFMVSIVSLVSNIKVRSIKKW